MHILPKGKYYGDKRAEFNVAGIHISEYDYHAPRTAIHYHENPYFMYVLEGKLYDRNKQDELLCLPGSLIFHNWQETHWNEMQTDYGRGFHIEFERSWYESQKLNIDLWEGSQQIEHPKVHHILAQIYSEFRCQDAFSSISIELLLFELCEQVERERIQPETFLEPPWIRHLKEIIHAGQEPLDLKSLSIQLGVHPVHISRAIPKYLSSTLGTYIRQYRVKRSLPYLMDAHKSLTEIAYICGFSDQSHFIRCFKAGLNMTPGKYRSQFYS